MNDLEKKIKKLVDAKIAPSAFNINGWQGQYDKMLRFYERTINAVNDTDRLDFALTFFQNCFHLREWIPITESIDKSEWNKKWTKLIATSKEMKICRDICNVTKHLKLDQKPSIDKDFAIFKEYNPFHKETNTRENDWSVFVNGQRYSLPDLMQACINSWNNFIRTEIKIK